LSLQPISEKPDVSGLGGRCVSTLAEWLGLELS
jgi:hypothetical protein